MRSQEPVCAKNDAECSNTIFKVLSGLNFGQSQITGGWLAAGTDRASGSVSIAVASGDLPVGDFKLGRFEAIYLPGSEAVRLRLTLGQTSVLFLCEDENDSQHIPGIGRISNVCEPDKKLGFGGTLGELQYDPTTGRFAGKWAQFNVALNLVGSPQRMAYLRRHLNLIVGADAETIWHGDKDGSDSDSFSRAILGVSGVVRSKNAKWEANTDLAFRPVIFGTPDALQDFGLTSNTNFLYHYLTRGNTLWSGGLQVTADHWSDPRDSFGPFDSVTRKNTLYIGAVLGARFEFSKY